MDKAEQRYNAEFFSNDKPKYKNPALTVDAILHNKAFDEVVLVERVNEPHGWALPGGFVDYGESCEHAIDREVFEETSLIIGGLEQFKVYSDPKRDPRQHVITVVFTGLPCGIPEAGDDAKTVKLFYLDNLPELAFDHKQIIEDYKRSLK